MEAPFKARFRELSTYDMKDILHQRMFETQQHNSHEVHQLLYVWISRCNLTTPNNLTKIQLRNAGERRRNWTLRGLPQGPRLNHHLLLHHHLDHLELQGLLEQEDHSSLNHLLMIIQYRHRKNNQNKQLDQARLRQVNIRHIKLGRRLKPDISLQFHLFLKIQPWMMTLI